MQVRYFYLRNLCTGLRSRSTLSSLKLKRPSDSDSELGDSANGVFKQISSIFHSGKSVKKPDSEEINGAREFAKMSNLSWLSSVSQANILLQRKEQSRKKKQKCIFEFTQENRFQKLIEVCAKMLGPEATLELFDKVGREPGVKGYNALVEMCIDKARGTDDEEIAIKELGQIFNLFKSMKEQGLELQEQTYRPLLLYMIDMCMVEEFQFFCVVIKDENPSSVTRLGYYEMLLWLKVDNEEKIQDICNYIAENDGEDLSDIRESYLLALCESERIKEILKLLEIIGIKNLSSAESVAKIFQALGRLLLEPVAEKFLLDFKTSDHEADNITNFIASYAVSIPNLSVEDVIKKFKDLHQRLEVSPSSSSYEKLILQSCALLKVKVILDPLIPPNSLNQIKGNLVSVLASHGQLSEALVIYEEIKQAGHKLEAKDVMTLIEHIHSEGELDKLLLLLDELDDTDYWNDACCRIILYCIWNKHLSSAVELCNLLKDKFQDDEQVMEILFDKVFSVIEESDSSHLHTCL